MTKSQFNIKISTDLLTRIKRQATMSGKSLTEHITCLVTKSLDENNIEEANAGSLNDFKDLEKRLLHVESIVGNREYISKKLKPFTNLEAINCTKFMRGFFQQEVKNKSYDNIIVAFNDLYKHIENYDQLNKNFIYRLKEILTDQTSTPWTGTELNQLTGSMKCNCSIRKGLINWAGAIDFPSQQEICDKGEDLLPL